MIFPVTKQITVIDNLLTGDKVRCHRMSKDFSLREIAILMGISASFLSDLELGHRGWTENLVDKFNDAMSEKTKGGRTKK